MRDHRPGGPTIEVQSAAVTVLTVLVGLLRLVLGGLLILAGILKLRDPTAFATEVANYQLMPLLAPYVAATLPSIELLVGGGLIFFPRSWRRAAVLAALVLLVGFSLAVGSAYFRHIDVDCGCFGVGGGPITALTLLRDLALVAAAVALLVLDRAGSARSRPG